MAFFFKIAAAVLTIPATVVVMLALGLATGWDIFFSTTFIVLAVLTVDSLVAWLLFRKVA